MALFVVEYTYDHTLDSLLETFRPAHRQFLRELHEQGVLVASGFLKDGTCKDALLIIRTESVPDVDRILADDPFGVHGFVSATRIREWVPTFGDLAQGFDTEFQAPLP